MKKAGNTIVYVTRHRERGEGTPEGKNYHIISGDGSMDTYKLLSLAETEKELNKSGVSLLVFKNNSQIEKLAKEKGWKLLNPKAELSEEIENKISQVKWLGKLARYLPEHEISKTSEVKWKGKPFILQWAHGHTGDGTILVKDERELGKIKKDFPDREARATEYINGPVFTANIVVEKNKILVGNISYQITGMAPFTDNAMSTIGNDWSITNSILSERHLREFHEIAEEIGEKMRKDGWKGLFGIDFIYDEERDRILLLEINARQSASSTYESELQRDIRGKDGKGLTIFEAHLKALSGEKINEKLIEINDGAQIVQRVTKTINNFDKKRLEDLGYRVIIYSNKKENGDLARIQSKKGIMEAHNKFNKRGKEILGS